MLKEYDIVLAKRDLSSKVLKGTGGTILLVLHSNPNVYEVEFLDSNYEHIELLTVYEDDIQFEPDCMGRSTK